MNPPRAEIAVPVTIYIPEHLHLWAVEAAKADDKSLAYWIIGLIAQAKSGDRR
jgi:predicted HicB family RNase H-like nuclease